MGLYREAYVSVLKKDFMLLIIAIGLAFFTFAYWIGIPLFVVGDMLDNLHMPTLISIVCVFLLIGLLLSLFFIPLNLKVARVVRIAKQQSMLKTFTRLQLGFAFWCAASICFIFFLIVWISEAL